MVLSENKKIYSIILDKKVKADIDKIAKEQDRSGSSMVNWVLKKYIDEYKEKDKK